MLTSLKSLLKVSRYSHAAVGISIKKDKRKRRLEAGRDFPETKEISRLLAAAEGDTKRRALLLIIAFTGLRASELRGLRWSDVDLKAAELHVRQRADRYNNIGSPKSDFERANHSIRSRGSGPRPQGMETEVPAERFCFSHKYGAD